MNPDSAIRPWLIAVGRQYGIRQAYNYRMPDPTTRTQEPYFTYRVMRGRQQTTQFQRHMSKDGYTAIWGGMQSHDTIVRIRLYREVNGVEILAKCAISAAVAEPLKIHFKKSGCAFKGIYEDIEDESPNENDITDGDFLDQIVQRMDVVFHDDIWSEFRETNGIVETLDLDLGLV